MRTKKRLLCLLLAGIVLAASLAGCAEEAPQAATSAPTEAPEIPYAPESALALWDKINETMNGLRSVEMTISTNQVYYAMGQKYARSSTSYILTTHDVHYTESKSELICEELSFRQTVDMVEAYWDGMMYRAVSDGVYDQKFCSEMSHEDYDRLQSSGLTGELGIADCTTSSFSATEEGLLNLSFQGYTKKTIDQAMRTLGLTEEGMGAAITDMQVHLTANADFFVQEMHIAFIFEESAHLQPAFTVDTVYSGWNAATFDSSRLDTEAYTKVADVHVLDAISAAIQDWQEAEIGQFTLDTDITEEYEREIRTAEENGTMTYGWKNGAFCYFFTANTDGESYQVQYQSGEQTVISNGKSYTVAQPEGEAIAYIYGLIDSAEYNPLVITSIERREDGAYILTSDRPDVSDYAGEIEDIFATQQIIAIFENGKLAQISSSLSIKGDYRGGAIAITNNSTVTFSENAELPEL